MAIETVAQNTQSSFADPQNGTSPIDADEVTANDNALRAKFNTHDADDTIHLQGSALADRPAAGVAGRKWMTRDVGSLRIFRDTGSAWEEITYIPSSSDATISGIITFSTPPVFSTAQSFVDDVNVGGDLAVTGTLAAGASTLASAGVTGNATVGGTLGVTSNATVGGMLGVTGAVTGVSFAGSGAALTSLPAANLTGALPAISGASLTNLNATNLASGTVSASLLPTTYTSATTFSAGTTGAVTISAGGALKFIDTGGAAGSLPAADIGGVYFKQGASTPPAFGATAPASTGGWSWIRVTTNNGTGTGYIPIYLP
jgi:hypothetical protein